VISTDPPSDGGTRPRISIVVPAFNREHFLGATLDSVRAQTLPAWELVVYDDGSSDGTIDVARRYADRDHRISVSGGSNGGVAAARNRGLAATSPSTEFVIFLDSDDVWVPDALATLVAALDAQPELSSAHSIARCIDGDGQPLPGDDLEVQARRRTGFHGGRLVDAEPGQPTTFAELIVHNWVLTPGTHLIRRSVIDQVGPFDVSTDPADDWDMALRISRCGAIGFIDRALLLWRRHGSTLTNTSPRWRHAYFLVRRRALTHPGNTPEQTRLARLSFQQANRAAVRQVWRYLSDRNYREGVRQAAKSVQQYILYLRADIPARVSEAGHRFGKRRRLGAAA
jgi:glycosyltransferase involved in cell wall biosynthesis